MFGHAGVGGNGGQGNGPFGGFGGFGDIFDAFFGGNAQPGTRRTRRPAGADLRYDLRLTFDEAVHGTEKEIAFDALDACPVCSGSGAEPGTQPTTCPQCSGSGEIRQVRSTMLGQMVNITACPRCHGSGQIVETPCRHCRGEGRLERKKTLRVTIPAGIDEGHQIRLSGEGEAGPRGGTPGSLYVVTHVDEHPVLKRDGTELYLELTLSVTQAALGTEVPVRHAGRRGAARRQARHPAGHRDPPPRQGCGPPASTRAARRPPRAHRRRGPDPTLARASASSRGAGRRGGGARLPGCAARPGWCGRTSAPIRKLAPTQAFDRRPHQGRDRLSDPAATDGTSAAGTWLELSVLGGPRGGRGRERDPRPSRARRRVGRDPVHDGRRRPCGAHRRDATGDRPRIPPGAGPYRLPIRRYARSATPRASPGLRPAADRRAGRSRSSTKRTGRAPGRSISRSCASAARSSSARRWREHVAARARSSSASTRAWPSGPGCTPRPGSASRASSAGRTRDWSMARTVLDVGTRVRASSRSARR